MDAQYHYGDHVTLRQNIISEDHKVTPYYIWDTYYTPESLQNEVNQAGFNVCGFFGDVTGIPFDDESKVIATLLEKKI